MQLRTLPVKHSFFAILMTLLCAALLWHEPAAADIPTTPRTNNGEKWRIAYYQGGNYQNYPVVLKSVTESLVALGWIDKFNWPQSLDMNDPQQMWDWLAANVNSPYIEFLKQGFFTCDWDKEKRQSVKEKAIAMIGAGKTVDLVFAMGTWAGQDLATGAQPVPTIVMSTSNPVESKIIKSSTDSGHDNVFTNVDPTRYQRQVQIFYDILRFKKLGIVYEDTVAGRSYAALDDVNKVVSQNGFEVVTCNAPFSGVSEQQAESAVLACHQKLAQQVDAFYLTVHRGVTSENLKTLLQPFYQNNIPMFSQLGGNQVRNGALMSISRAGFKYLGQFYARGIAHIFNGATPRKLSMLFEEPPRIALNLEVAKMIGFDPPLDVLAAADEIYQSIGQEQ